MAPLDVGMALGILQLTCAVVGTFAGAFLTEQLQRDGHPDAHLRTVIVTSWGAAIGLLAPFMPTIELALAFWALAIICLSGYFGSIVAALQVLTPNNRRGANSAVMILIQSSGGLAVGTLLIGTLADFAFADAAGNRIFAIVHWHRSDRRIRLVGASRVAKFSNFDGRDCRFEFP